jgi:hypothetical protein
MTDITKTSILPHDTWKSHPHLGPCRGRHYCNVRNGITYMMGAGWIDTDNNVWGEPFHLYIDLHKFNHLSLNNLGERR